MTDAAEASPATGTAALVAATFREDQGVVVASLLRSFGDLDLAEDAVQEAFAIALQVWGTGGGPVPRNPGAWIMTTARNRLIDRLRRDGRLADKTAEMAVELDRRQIDPQGVDLDETVPDDRLRLLFTCCHPSLDLDAQVALTLRLVGGLTTEQIASSFLVSTTTMAARLTRAKKRVRAAETPLRMPDDDQLPGFVAAVRRVVYLVFNQGYLNSSDGTVVDVDLVDEAIRLARLLTALVPSDPEMQGLLALLLLCDARRGARLRGGHLVLLDEQDRGRWDAQLASEGISLVQQALRRGRPGPYQLQAAIQAVHMEAAHADDTDWQQVAALYGVLEVLDPSPVVTLNRSVAVHRSSGPESGLALLATVEESLDGYHLLHASRATMLAAAGDVSGAVAAWRQAVSRTDNPAELAFIRGRISELLEG